MYYTTSQPAPNTGYSTYKGNGSTYQSILSDRRSTLAQTTSMVLRHMFKFLITLHCGSSLLCWFDRGVDSTSHGPTLLYV